MAGKSEGRRANRVSRKDKGGSDEKSGYSRNIRARQIAKNTKKSGCVPKLFMLLLPFLAAGTYLLLRS